MTIVLFDVDGTLTETMEADSACFAAALREQLGGEVDEDWVSYAHVTDAGIVREAFERRHGAPPDAGAVARVRRRFLALYGAATARPCGEVPGAEAMLRALTGEWRVPAGLATGCWRESAELKLRQAGLEGLGLPLATADDAEARVEIMRLALTRVAERWGLAPPLAAVYVGDGVWDGRAARQLGWPFVGVGAGERARRLVAEGARAVVPNYLDRAAFVDALRACGLGLPSSAR